MKRLLNLTGFLMFALAVKAQDLRTITLASENNLPFYVKVAGKTLNSTRAGLLTIPGLRDTTYEITIGFTDNRYPDQQFKVGIEKTDMDFDLKNLGDKGWALQDIKTQKLINSTISRSSAPAHTQTLPQTQNGGDVQQIKRTDAFAIMMAAVVNDTAVLYTSVSRNETPTEIKKPVVDEKTETVAKNDNPPQAQIPKKDTPISTANIVDPVKTSDSGLAKKTEEAGNKEEKKVVAIDSSKSIVAKTEAPKREEKTTPPVVLVPDANKDEQINESLAAQKALDSVNEKKAADQLAADKVAADKLAADKAAADKLAADKAIADKAAADKAAADKLAADKAAADKLAADKAAADKLAADKAAADKLSFEKKKAADSALANNNTIIPNTETSAGIKAKTVDTSVANKKESIQLDNKTRIFKLGVVKVTEQKEEKGLHMIFIDRSGPEHADTIQILIPTETPVPGSAQPSNKTDGSSLKTNKSDPVIVKKDSVKKEYAPDGPVWRPIEKKETTMVNSDCKNFATEYDLDKLRVRMIADNNAEDRINTAKKVFRTKCFTTRQIRALSELFINDEGKYKFLDAAYPYVSDSGSFKSLADLLKDQYYINRFNAMLRN